MKFFPIPDARKGAVTKEMLVNLQQANVIPHNIGMFASDAHFIEAVGVMPPQEGAGRKLWRDNATIWQPSRAEFSYVMIERGTTGEFNKVDLTAEGDRMGFSDPSFEIYSLGTANFYREYIKHFPLVPRLVLRGMTRNDAMRLNFSAGTAEDYPLGMPTGDEIAHTTFPSNMALRFNPQTGQPEAFYWEEYVREFRPETEVSTSLKLGDEELVNVVTGVILAKMTVKEKALAIRQLAGR